MTQTSSTIIVAVKPCMEYAKLCMSMRLGDARTSACENVLLIATTRLPTQRSILDRNEDPGRADADSFAAARALGRG
jgi:hypothetical protein